MRLYLTQLRRKIWEKLYFAEKYDEKSYFWSGCGGASDTGHWLPKFQILSINQTGLPENLSLRQNVSLDLRLVATIAELNLGPNITFPRYHSSISNIVSLDHLTMGELLQQLNIIEHFQWESMAHGLTISEIGSCIRQIIINWKLTHPHSPESNPPSEAWTIFPKARLSEKTSQELRMLSPVTLYSRVTM